MSFVFQASATDICCESWQGEFKSCSIFYNKNNSVCFKSHVKNDIKKYKMQQHQKRRRKAGKEKSISLADKTKKIAPPTV